MPTLHEVHNEIVQNKKERREIVQSFKDECRNNARHQEIVEEMERLTAEKKGIENEIRARAADAARLEEIKIDINTNTILLADIALNMYINRENVEIVDDFNVRWIPAFKVQFKKS